MQSSPHPATPTAPQPANVPDDLMFDFDCFAPEGWEEDVHVAWKRLHAVAPDIFWTPRNGGHWVATRGGDIRRIQMDNVNFSHRGLSIPYDPAGAVIAPVMSDPPVHKDYRALIQPAFLPKAVDRLEARARTLAIELVEQLAPLGGCEFIADFAKVLPIAVFMEMVDIPWSDHKRLLMIAEKATRAKTAEQRNAAMGEMAAYAIPFMQARMQVPGDDLISLVANAELPGGPIEFEEALGVIMVLLFGGLDTVASLIGFTARFLAMNPGHRQQILDDPAIIKTAIEELIRRHGLTNTARLVVNDIKIGDATLTAGQQIQLPNALFGLDDRRFDDPMTVDFHREMPIQLAAFGAGPHTCPGAILARRELKVFLEEWLPRIPDFEIAPDSTPVLETGAVHAVHRLELTWPVQ